MEPNMIEDERIEDEHEDATEEEEQEQKDKEEEEAGLAEMSAPVPRLSAAHILHTSTPAHKKKWTSESYVRQRSKACTWVRSKATCSGMRRRLVGP